MREGVLFTPCRVLFSARSPPAWVIYPIGIDFTWKIRAWPDEPTTFMVEGLTHISYERMKGRR